MNVTQLDTGDGRADITADYAVLCRLLDDSQIVELRQAASRFVNRYPDHGLGSKLLGLACLMLGDSAAGVHALQRASVLMPEAGETLDLLACAFNMQGRHGEAAAVFERSLAVAPERAETWVNTGKNRRDMGDATGAAAAYRRAIELRPELGNAYHNLSAVLCELGQAAEALAAIDRSLQLVPDAPWGHVNRGNALKELRRYPEAIEAYDRALQLSPSMHEAWDNLADVLQRSGDTVQAVAAAERALALDPDDPGLLNTLGTLYAIQKRPVEAEALLRRALSLQPDNPAFWLNLGNVLGEVGDKIDCYRKALALKPDFEAAQSLLVFHLNYAAGPTPEELLAEARHYGQLVGARVVRRTGWENERKADRVLRIGIVSADLCQHPVAYFLEATLMAARDKGFVWVAYSGTEKTDEVTTRLRTRFDEWCDALSLSDAELEARIVADRIDLLLDLSGHTAGHRLAVLAAKPAPVQATWLGYVGTTGVAAIDYLLADPHVLPEGVPSHTVETPWRLPECYMSFTRPPFEIALTDPPLLANTYPTFGCFNDLAKVNDRVLDTWARILRAVPDARLLLRARQLSDGAIRERVLARFAAAGVDVARIEAGGSLPSREEGMREYARVDVALDPFPYTGATTSVEALWMGVPVLTLRGDRFIARVGESFNRNVGLEEWIADGIDDYVARAQRLCRDGGQLQQLRQSLRRRGAASPLGNPVWFANQLETALRGMWRKYCSVSRDGV